MKNFKNRDFTDTVRKRIVLYWVLLVLMIIYNVVVGEMGLGDSRKMSPLADDVSRIIYFGGLIYVITKIVQWNKILKDKRRLMATFQSELDERRKFLHDKSGGLIFDILLFVLLVITCTAALSDNTAFLVSLLILLIAIVLKAVSYFIYSKKY